MPENTSTVIPPGKTYSLAVQMVSQRVIERLAIYRRILENLLPDKEPAIFSHQLADLAGTTAAQVRQDLRVIGYAGSTRSGYQVARLLKGIDDFFSLSETEPTVLVGVGNLGMALITYFSLRNSRPDIVAAFDTDPEKVGKVYHGCRCFSMDELNQIVKEQYVRIGIIAVPTDAAQETADSLAAAGIRGILNFAPVTLRGNHGIFIENIDLTLALEKVAFFSKQ